MITKDESAYLYILKGLGILLVVLGHTNIPNSLVNMIFSFHMPLFFFISGYLFDYNKYQTSFFLILEKKAKSLLWPYVTFSLYALFFSVVLYNKEIYNINGMLLGMYHSINGPLWFLTTLFSTQIIFALLLKVKNFKFILFTVVFLGFINQIFFNLRLFFNVDVACSMLIFFYLGFIIKQLNITFYQLKNCDRLYLLLISILLFTVLFFISKDLKFNVLYGAYSSLEIFFISTVLGICLIKIISILIFRSKNLAYKFFIFLGKNTLIIYATHLIYARLVNEIVGRLVFGLHKLIILLLIYLTVILVNRHFKFMIQYPFR